jgi:hypothetical protein
LVQKAGYLSGDLGICFKSTILPRDPTHDPDSEVAKKAKPTNSAYLGRPISTQLFFFNHFPQPNPTKFKFIFLFSFNQDRRTAL